MVSAPYAVDPSEFSPKKKKDDKQSKNPYACSLSDDDSIDDSWDEESDFGEPDDYYDEEEGMDDEESGENSKPKPEYVYNIKGEIVDIHLTD